MAILTQQFDQLPVIAEVLSVDVCAVEMSTMRLGLLTGSIDLHTCTVSAP